MHNHNIVNMACMGRLSVVSHSASGNNRNISIKPITDSGYYHIFSLHHGLLWSSRKYFTTLMLEHMPWVIAPDKFLPFSGYG